MKASSLPYFFFSLALVFGCKTAEQIKKEQQMESLSVQMVQSQKTSGELTSQLQSLEERVASLNGKIEELEYGTKKERENSESTYNNRLNALEEQIKILEEKFSLLGPQLEQNREFLEKVTKTLAELKASPSPKESKKKVKNELSEAFKLLNSSKYRESEPVFLEALSDKKLPAATKARVTHALGVIRFKSSKPEDAAVFFSKVYTEHPQSPYGASSLLHLAKIFRQKGQVSEAKSALNELLDKYPKSKHVAEAKGLLQKLN